MSVHKDVKFLQYVAPRGEKRDMLIDRPLEIAMMAERIWAAGYRLEAEVLSDGIVSLTVSDDLGDYGGELCHNGPGLEQSVDKLIIEFNQRLDARS